MPITRRHASKALLGAGLGGLTGAGAPGAAAAAAPAASPPVALPAALPAAPQSGSGSLAALARAKGMDFGNAIGISASGSRKASRFHDAAYRELMARECGVIVAENETKWQALRPRDGEFSFARADEMFGWARQQGMRMRGHTLMWQAPKWLPQWVNEHDFGAQPRREAERLLRAHVATVCGHFGPDVYSWDVVNEAVDPEHGGALRSNVFTRQLGAVEQIDLMFRLAHEHAPHAQLVYNDYMSWGGGDAARHRAGVLELLEALKARGTPVHALGLQSHIGAGDTSAFQRGDASQEREWRKFLEAATAMDLDLLISEFDVNDRAFPAEHAVRDAAVAAHARRYLELTLSFPRLRCLMLWGMADPYSWLQDFSPRADGLPMRPCPYDAQMQPKPLRAAIADALRAMPPRAAV